MDSASSIFSALYRRLPVIALVLIGALSTGVYYARRTPTEYVAFASLISPGGRSFRTVPRTCESVCSECSMPARCTRVSTSA
jgi:hypothetical protein